MLPGFFSIKDKTKLNPPKRHNFLCLVENDDIMPRWWIGCSGFYYKAWREKFYPKGLAQRKWFEYYCEHFNTVELNVTFYRFPKLSFLKSWYDRSPRSFRFTVKAPRLITHYKRFNETEDLIAGFYSRLEEGLHDKLGTVLFQMHPRMEYTDEKLRQILDSMNPKFQNVIEFRHVSWWNDEVLKSLKRRKITFCSISYPDLPDDVICTAKTFYYRFHGVPELYRSLYSEKFLRKIKKKISDQRAVKEVYCYFNNDIDASAITNAKQLQSLTT